MPNPLNQAMLFVLEAREPCNRLDACLTLVMTRLVNPGGIVAGQPLTPVSFATDLRTASIEIRRLADQAHRSSLALTETLVGIAIAVEGGQDPLTLRVDEVPWSPPRRPRG